MDAEEFRSGALALARSASLAVTRSLSEQADLGQTLSGVLGTCEQLRESARDEISQHLIGLIDHAIARLRIRPWSVEHTSKAIDDSDSSEIVLVKALWALEEHLSRLSLVH